MAADGNQPVFSRCYSEKMQQAETAETRLAKHGVASGGFEVGPILAKAT
jgi:hypothetical protein